jgi:hypothetical protein
MSIFRLSQQQGQLFQFPSVSYLIFYTDFSAYPFSTEDREAQGERERVPVAA